MASLYDLDGAFPKKGGDLLVQDQGFWGFLTTVSLVLLKVGGWRRNWSVYPLDGETPPKGLWSALPSSCGAAEKCPMAGP